MSALGWKVPAQLGVSVQNSNGKVAKHRIEEMRMKMNHGVFQLLSTPIGTARWSVTVRRMDRARVHYQGKEEREVVIRLDASSDDEAIQKVRHQIDQTEIS